MACCVLSFNLLAQNSVDVAKYDCKVLNELLADVPKGFLKTRDKVTELKDGHAIWGVNIKMPGAKSAFLSDDSTYKASMYEGASLADAIKMYDWCRNMFDACLSDDYGVVRVMKTPGTALYNYPDIQYSKELGHGHDHEGHQHIMDITQPNVVLRIYMSFAYTEASGMYNVNLRIHK